VGKRGGFALVASLLIWAVCLGTWLLLLNYERSVGCPEFMPPPDSGAPYEGKTEWRWLPRGTSVSTRSSRLRRIPIGPQRTWTSRHSPDSASSDSLCCGRCPPSLSRGLWFVIGVPRMDSRPIPCGRVSRCGKRAGRLTPERARSSQRKDPNPDPHATRVRPRPPACVLGRCRAGVRRGLVPCRSQR
jgi:hypothetical protein